LTRQAGQTPLIGLEACRSPPQWVQRRRDRGISRPHAPHIMVMRLGVIARRQAAAGATPPNLRVRR
jgi:hypothetical protein